MTTADSLEDKSSSNIANKVIANTLHADTHNINNHEKPYKQ